MFKKGIAAAGCLAVVAAGWSYAATTWQLQTKLSNAGGKIQVRDKAFQTTAGSIAYNNFTTSALIPVKVYANPGYKISSVKKGTITQTITDNQLFTINVDKTGGLSQSVVASFTANQYTINGAVVGSGTISPTSTAVSYGGSVVFSTSPSTSGTVLTSVSAGTVKDLGGNAVTLPYAGPVKVTLSNVQAAQTVTATYTTVSVSAGADKVVGLGAATTIYGSISAGDTISWTQVSGPETVDTSAWTTATPSFTAPAAGTYVFKATEGLAGLTDLVEITATSDVTAYMQSACDGCHNATTGVSPSTAFNKWSVSTHAANNISCVTCHTEGAMPTPVNTQTVDPVTFKVLNSSAGTVGANYCVKCHSSSLNDHARSEAKCSTCHNVHQPEQISVTTLADNYVGSESCGACHTDKYATFLKSGHNFKINKIVNNQMPVYPFSNISGALENMPATTTINTLGKPISYADVTYVVGGYAWKARWIDKNGYIVSSTTQGVQYNLAYPATNQVLGQGWSTYGAVQKKYTCGECHTTGWKYYSGTDVTQKQDGLSGMPGTWVQAGVQCEACHGPGKDHAQAPAATNITKVAAGRTQAQLAVSTGYANPVTCGECHTRDGERNPYGGEGAATDGTFRSAYNLASGTNDIIGGRIRASSLNNPIGGHHQTGDEMFGIDPDNLAAGPMGKHRKAGMNCGTCHDPHKTTFYQNVSGDGLGVDVACTSCHEVTFTATGAAHSNADCIRCHMPKLAKSAVSTGPNAAGKTLGDIRTHVFKIDLSAATNVAAADGGKFLKPFITKDYACGECHATPANNVSSLTANYGGRIHATITYKHPNSNLAPTGDSCLKCHNGTNGAVSAKVSLPTANTPAASTPILQGDYVGTGACRSCHADQFATFVQSGHNFKMSKVVNGQVPSFPFSTLDPTNNGVGVLALMPATTTGNTLGKPTSYDQVSYVVGGYGWKARWFDLDGYLVTSGTQGVQYNLANGSWSTYAGTQKKYDCGECHTTGWKYSTTEHQDGLPGMSGTWEMTGVQCEACHGGGAQHAATGNAADITRVAAARTQAQLLVDEGHALPVHCGECHTRDGERNSYAGSGSTTDYRSAYNQVSGTTDVIGGRIVAGGSIGNHHQSYDELLGVLPADYDLGSGTVNSLTAVGKHLPAGVSCDACHNPHKTTKYQDHPNNTAGPGVDVSCASCHAAKTSFTVAAHTGLACINCHMPKLTKSATSAGTNLAGKTLGDIKTHLFKINLNAAAQFVTVGTKQFMYPFATKDYACGSCHAVPADKVNSLNTTYGGKIHP